jgi:FkbM family methyltransferase
MHKIVNPFVYQRILESEMPNSTIPAWLGESYTQCYEDILIDAALRVHVRKLGRHLNGLTYIEIGANHPVCTSSSYYFYRKYNIRGTLVEANPKLINSLTRFRQGDRIVNAAACDSDETTIDFYISPDNEISSIDERFVNAWKDLGVQEKITVPTIRVNALLEQAKDHEAVILIIDVEGLDLRLLKDIDFEKYQPLIIEVEPSDGFAPGTSNAMIEFLATKNYTLIGETDVNLIFQRG